MKKSEKDWPVQKSVRIEGQSDLTDKLEGCEVDFYNSSIKLSLLGKDNQFVGHELSAKKQFNWNQLRAGNLLS